MIKFLLKEEKTFLGKCANIALAYIIMAIWTVGIVQFYEWLFAVKSWSPFGQISQYENPILIQLFLVCIIAPLWEEIVFRKLPLDLVKSTRKKELYMPVILASSVIFGLGHYGVPSLLIQGVGGFVMSCLYIKNGFSYWSSVALHFLWNFSLFTGTLIL